MNLPNAFDLCCFFSLIVQNQVDNSSLLNSVFDRSTKQIPSHLCSTFSTAAAAATAAAIYTISVVKLISHQL
jgi:hypothetical protein